ncbi:Nucleolar Complex 2 protein [Blastocladiella emersonii ATCC 22665]|nr:Nucleolar Complex 2 protein [Blastocladiella emersonii ATCC 22665]
MAPRGKGNFKNKGGAAAPAPAKKAAAPKAAGKAGKAAAGKKPAGKSGMSLDAFLAAEPDMDDEEDAVASDVDMDDMSDGEYGDLPAYSDDDEDEDADDESDASDADEEEEASDDDEEDAEAEDADEASKHKRELEKLKESQPEFYQFLLENDSGLLDFDNSDHELEDDAADAESAQFIQEAAAKAKTVITKELIGEWEKDLDAKVTTNNIKRIVVAFRSAVQGDKDSETLGFSIGSTTVHRKIIILAFKHVPVYLTGLLGTSPTVASSPKWKKVSAMVKVFVTNALKLLKDLTDASMVEFLLQELHSCVRYLLAFPRVSKDYFRLLLSLWGTSQHDHLRVKAFASIRYLAETHPKKFLEPALKGTYMMFVKTCRRTTVHTLPTINLLTRCAAEAYGLDADMSYQFAFIYIRQLAIHLRNAMAAKTKESYKLVYQWQYVHSLRFWASILITYAPRGAKHPLAALVYPLVQVMSGVIRLVPTPHYHPLHLHLLASLTDIARVCGVYIPLAPYYQAILDGTTADAKAKKSTLKPLYLPTYIRCPKQYAGTRVYASNVRNAVYMGQLRYLAALSANIAFPELTIPVVVGLKAQLKATKDPAWHKTVQGFLDKIDENRKFIAAKRQAADVAPCDANALVNFMNAIEPSDTPLGKFAAGVEKVEAKRMAMLQASFTADYDAFGESLHDDAAGKKKKGGKQQQVSDSEEDSEDDMEVDSDEDVSEDASDEEEAKPAPKAAAARKPAAAKKAAAAGRKQGKKADLADDDDFMAELRGLTTVSDDMDMDMDSD